MLGELLGRCCSDEVTSKAVGLSSSHRREAMKEMSRTAIEVWALPSVKKTFNLANEESFRKYATDEIDSMHVC